MDYQVKVDNFGCPMDLLLFVIHRERLNIYDIPIAHITKELSELIGDHSDPALFENDHAS